MHLFRAAAAIAVLTCFITNLTVTTAVGQSATITPAAPIGKGVVVIKAARLMDGTGKPAINNAVVVVTDNVISAVGTAAQVKVPSGAKVIDLGDATLLPGFID